jgi:hypothetical protein
VTRRPPLTTDEATRLVFGLAIQRERSDDQAAAALLRGLGPMQPGDAAALGEVAVRAFQALAELASTQKGVAPVDALRHGALLAAS